MVVSLKGALSARRKRKDRILRFHDIQTFLSHVSQLASARFEPSTAKLMTHRVTFYFRHCTENGRPLACFVMTTNVKTLQSTIQFCCYCEHQGWIVDVIYKARQFLSDGTHDGGPLVHDHPLRTWAKLRIKTGHDLQVVHGRIYSDRALRDLAVHQVHGYRLDEFLTVPGHFLVKVTSGTGPTYPLHFLNSDVAAFAVAFSWAVPSSITVNTFKWTARSSRRDPTPCRFPEQSMQMKHFQSVLSLHQPKKLSYS
jgi:hypothetical protein